MFFLLHYSSVFKQKELQWKYWHCSLDHSVLITVDICTIATWRKLSNLPTSNLYVTSQYSSLKRLVHKYKYYIQKAHHLSKFTWNSFSVYVKQCWGKAETGFMFSKIFESRAKLLLKNSYHTIIFLSVSRISILKYRSGPNGKIVICQISYLSVSCFLNCIVGHTPNIEGWILLTAVLCKVKKQLW